LLTLVMMLPFLIQVLSQSKPAAGPSLAAQSQQTSGRKQVPKVEDFLATRDYTGALTVLEVRKVTKLVCVQRHHILYLCFKITFYFTVHRDSDDIEW
jgi:hypothetical protein